jgi:hypothetical protein
LLSWSPTSSSSKLCHMSFLPPSPFQCSSLPRHPSRHLIHVLHNTQTKIIASPCISCNSNGEIPIAKKWRLIKQNKTSKTCCVHTSVVTYYLVTNHFSHLCTLPCMISGVKGYMFFFT